jgi:hypothetical protein
MSDEPTPGSMAIVESEIYALLEGPGIKNQIFKFRITDNDLKSNMQVL